MENQITVSFPQKYIEFSKAIQAMTKDIALSDTVPISLPATQQTINYVFAILDLYNENGDLSKIRTIVKSYSLSTLVDITNLLQYLDVSSDIIEILMDQIAAILNDVLTHLLRSLNDYIYEQNRNIVFPYYEPLRKLNPDVERTIKEKSFKIKNILQWQVKDIWAAIGIHNSEQESKRERERFELSTEKIASFLDRNVFARVLKFIGDSQRQKQEKQIINIQSNTGIGNSLANIANAAIEKIRALYHYYMRSRH